MLEVELIQVGQKENGNYWPGRKLILKELQSQFKKNFSLINTSYHKEDSRLRQNCLLMVQKRQINQC